MGWSMTGFKRGQIWLANLNPNKGTEPGKVRPVYIIQNQALLDCEHQTSIVLPLTTQLKDHAEPLRIRIKKTGKLKQDSDIMLDQIRAIDNKRLIDGPIATPSAKIRDQVDRYLLQVLGI